MVKPPLSSIFTIRVILWILFAVSFLLFVIGLFGSTIGIQKNAPVSTLHPPISIIAAILFGLCAVTFFLKLIFQKKMALASSVIVTILSLDLFLEDILYYEGMAKSIIHHLFSEQMANIRIFPAPNTSFCFFLLGMCLVFTSLNNRVLYSFLAIFFSCVSGAIASIAFLGYVLHLYNVTGWFGFAGMALHTSLGLISLSSGIFLVHTIYSFQKEKVLLGPIFGSVFFVSYLLLLLWKGYNASLETENMKHTQQTLVFTAGLIDEKVDNIAKAVRRIVQRFESNHGYSDILWQVDTENYENDMASIKSFVWLDGNFSIERIKNSSHFKETNHDLTSLIDDVKAMKFQSTTSKIYSILLQNELVLVIPYFEKDLLKGVLLAILDIDKLISSSIPQFLLDHYAIEFNQGNTTFFRITDPNSDLTETKSSKNLNSSYVNWSIDLIPYKSGTFESSLSKLFFIVSSALAVFIGTILYLFQLTFSQREKLGLLLKEKGDVLAYREAVINSANYAIICADETGVITEFNKAAEKMLQYSAKEMINKLTPAVFHDTNEVVERAKQLSYEYNEEISPGFEVFVRRARVKNIPDEGEWTYIRKDGTRFPVRLSVTAVKNTKGELIGYMGIAIDMTELKKIENMKNELMSVTTHELRAPLGTIKGALDVINESKALQGTEKQMLDIATRNAERLLRLTRDILDIQKMEAGKMDFNFIKLNLIDFMHKAIDSTQVYASLKHIALVYPESIPNITFIGDEDRLMQVVINYISNAVKNSPQHTSVYFPITVNDGMLKIGVKDEGPGIPQEYHSLIFQKFSQLPNNTHRNDGTGLGLNITRSIIENHHGTVGFDTGPGGTTFWFEIPLDFREDLSPRIPMERTVESS